MTAVKGLTEVTKEWQLKAGEEFRFEVAFRKTIKVTLVSGCAEYFGAELGPTTDYLFSGENGAIFSWEGCLLRVTGECQSAYVAGETPMDSYINVHMALQQKRVQAHKDISGGSEESVATPRVMIIGPEDSGKTSIAKLLLNYAVRMEETPLFVDLDPHEASITVPGTLSVTPVTHVISIEDSWMGYAEASSNAPPATPIVWQFGHEQPTDNAPLYKLLVDRVAQSIDSRLHTDRFTAGSGFVVDTRGVSDASKYEVLEYAAEKLRINVLIVVGNERMYSAFSSKLAGASVVKLTKSGGVVDREAVFRRQYNSRIVRQYFYGTTGNPVSSYSTITNFDDILVLRVGEDARAPSSTLPLGETRMVTDTSVLEVIPDESLSHSILAVTDAKRDGTKEDVIGMQALGFVSVTGVDMAKRRLTLLAPVPGRLQKPVLLYGATKWMET